MSDNNENIQNKEASSQTMAKTGDKGDVAPLSLFQKIIDLISGTDRDGRIKKKLIKEIKKQIGQSKYKFYNHKKDQIQPQFGNFFYEIYRLSQHCAKYFDVKNHSNTIKILLFDALLSKKQIEIKQKLEGEYIEDLLKTSNDTQKAIELIKNNLSDFVKSFDPEQVKKINTTFNQISDLSNLINYDWFSMLHKFDTSITEGNFNYKPFFELIEGKYITDELIAIIDYLETLNFNSDWKNIIDYLNLVSEDKGINDIFKKFINLLKSLKKEETILMMIRIITVDPYFRPKQFQSKFRIVQDYIHSYQSEVQTRVQNSIKSIKKDKVNRLLIDIFQTTVILRMKHYTQKIDESLKSRGFQNGFKYIEPMNYLKAFLLDICKGEIKSRVDNLIIKGTWDTNLHSSEFSSILDGFTKLSDKIIEFDNRCSEDDHYGRELRRLMVAIKHDSRAKLLLAKIIDKIDASANNLINDGILLFIKSGNMIKSLLEDHGLKNPKMIINFHHIKWDYSKDFRTDMMEIYKKISNVVTLLRGYASPVEKPPNKTE